MKTKKSFVLPCAFAHAYLHGKSTRNLMTTRESKVNVAS